MPLVSLEGDKKLLFFSFALFCGVQSILPMSTSDRRLLRKLPLFQPHNTWQNGPRRSILRSLSDNPAFKQHLKKLKEVHAVKPHNLDIDVKGPMMYIQNPVEAKLPKAYVAVKEFKQSLIDRVETIKTSRKIHPVFKTKFFSNTHPNKPTRTLPKLRTKLSKIRLKPIIDYTKKRSDVLGEIEIARVTKVLNKVKIFRPSPPVQKAHEIVLHSAESFEEISTQAKKEVTVETNMAKTSIDSSEQNAARTSLPDTSDTVTEEIQSTSPETLKPEEDTTIAAVTMTKEVSTADRESITERETTTAKKETNVTKEVTTTPKEEITTPKEEITTSKEEITTPKEEITTPKEEITTPKEEITTIKEETSTSEPEIATAEAETATPEPEIVAAEAEHTTEEPEPTTEEPETTTTEPETTTAEVEMTTDEVEITEETIPDTTTTKRTYGRPAVFIGGSGLRRNDNKTKSLKS